jgi:hypothetical protein
VRPTSKQVSVSFISVSEERKKMPKNHPRPAKEPRVTKEQRKEALERKESLGVVRTFLEAEQLEQKALSGEEA